MWLSMEDQILWALTFIGHATLLSVLFFKGRWRKFPIFTSLIGFYVLRTITLFFLYSQRADLYRTVYWTAAGIDIVLQIALIFEIAGIVLRPTGTWVQDARSSFLTWGAVGTLLAIGLSYAVRPSTGTTLDDWLTRGNLFTSLLLCELFLAIMLASHRLGLVWRNHVSNIGQGLTVWALVSTLVDTAHNYFPVNSYFGTRHHFLVLERFRIYAYLLALGYWIVTLWLPEPERKPISEELQKYIIALHAKVKYDSTQVSSVQNLR